MRAVGPVATSEEHQAVPVISLFSASYCNGSEVARRVAELLNYRVLTHDELLAVASERYGVPLEDLDRTIHDAQTYVRRWTRERERNIAYLQATMARMVQRSRFLHHGLAGHLIPRSVSHVIRVLLVADEEYRANHAASVSGLRREEARALLAKEDEEAARWTRELVDADPWDEGLYDLVLRVDEVRVAAAVTAICVRSEAPQFRGSPESRRAAKDFKLASKVNVALTDRGHDIVVTADAGDVLMTIDHYVPELHELELELKRIAAGVPGVKSVRAQSGPNFAKPAVYPELEVPRKILLVDDEKEFIRTLSERLETRGMGAALAYDGEEALRLIETDEPHVVVLDLKMPGIHGLEVLERIKQTHPRTEVIILTGHGSDAERERATALGAFAYLRKPADIVMLTGLLREAYAKFKSRAGTRAEGGAGAR